MLSDVGFSIQFILHFLLKSAHEKNAKTVHRLRLDHESSDISLIMTFKHLCENDYVSGRCFVVIRLNC